MTIPADAFAYGSFDEFEPGSLLLNEDIWCLRVRGDQHRRSEEGVLILSGNTAGNLLAAGHTKCLGLRSTYGWRPMVAAIRGSTKVPRYGSLMFGKDGPRFWGANAERSAFGAYGVDGLFHDPAVVLNTEVGVSDWSAEIFAKDEPLRTYAIFDLPGRTLSDS